jgi:gliding motility-associated-like protein
MKTRILCFLLLIIFSFPKYVSAQLEITRETDPKALAQRLVGSGVVISNVTLTGSPLSTGFFTNKGGASVGLNSGITLSTGRVLAEGGFPGLDGAQMIQASGQLGQPGDADLSALVNGTQTSDAVILEFDFIPMGDKVEFRYVFSSEEYPNYVCSGFNDAFAFFIEGPGITGKKNLALVPGTTIPIAINSINSGTAGAWGNITNCTAMGAGSPFTAYYVNNTGNTFFTHNGHTTVLVAQSAVVPCQTYHLKIAIADVGGDAVNPDDLFDSGVFLEARSLSSPSLEIINQNPLDGTTPYLVEGCHTGSIKVKSSQVLPIDQPFNLIFAGTAVNGTDVVTIPVTATIPANASEVTIPITPIVDNVAEGIEKLKIYVSNICASTGLYADEIEIDIRDYDKLAITPAGRIGVCSGSTIQLEATKTYATYLWTQGATLTNATIYNPVATPTADSTTYICTANLGNCNAQDSVKVKLKSLELVSKTDVNCAGASTGVIRVSGGWEWLQPVAYSINGGAYGTDSVFSNLPVGSYTVRIRDASGCIESLVVPIGQAFPDLVLNEKHTTASCVGANATVELSGNGGLAPYVFAMDGAPFVATSIFTVNSGAHTLAIRDANGCGATAPITITNDPAISITSTVNPASCSGAPDGVVTLTAMGGSTVYEYSANGTTFQTGSNFSLNVGAAKLFVRDNKGCTANHDVTVPLNNTATINAGADPTICEGTTYQLAAVTNATSVLWTGPGLSDPAIINPIATTPITATYTVTGTLGICTTTDDITIKVLPAPRANAGKDSTICYGKTIRLDGSGGVQYEWLPDARLQNTAVRNPAVNPLINSEYYLKVRDANGCEALEWDTVTVFVIPPVQAFAGRDTTIAAGQPLQMMGVDMANNEIANYKWSPSLGLNNTTLFNPVAVLERDNIYVLTLTTPEGCEGKDEVRIKVFKGPELYVPSGFTPNGDGKNDVLRVKAVGIKSFTLFKVYNRWGEPVFATTSENAGWDGTVRGIRQTTGVFIWIAEAIDYKGNKLQRKGSVTLLQ